MRLQQTEIQNDELLAQARKEVQKAQSYLEDADSMIERAIAIQWLLDQNHCREPFGLHELIAEWIEKLTYYHSALDDRGSEAYIELTQRLFLEHVQMAFCLEGEKK
jgi:hypothetical protein